tara:strand:+ start:22540 stop:23097 length:558 start_codon:yes stop_codon:yes gene_type:complete
MKNNILFIPLLFLLIGCSNQSKLSENFNCGSTKIENAKIVTDFNKNFKLTISSSWNTKLYFSKFESEIFVADTLKELTESFILGTSFNTGSLNFDTDFYKKTDSILAENNLQILNTGNQLFQSKPAYWYLAKGSKNGYTYHQFSLTSKQSNNTYFNGYVDIYGNVNINERICEAISILEKIEFFQ